MASFWFWLFAVILSLISGAIIIFLSWGFITMIKDLIIKKGIPKSKEGVTNYIKENEEKFDKTNPGKADNTAIKEVLENDRRSRQKYREFEKLRREELKARANGNESGARREGNNNNTSTRSEPLQRRELLQNVSSASSKLDTPRSSEAKSRVKLDE